MSVLQLCLCSPMEITTVYTEAVILHKHPLVHYLQMFCALVFTGDDRDKVPARRNASTQRRGELVGSKSEHQVQLRGIPFDTTEDEVRHFLAGNACLFLC